MVLKVRNIAFMETISRNKGAKSVAGDEGGQKMETNSGPNHVLNFLNKILLEKISCVLFCFVSHEGK